MQSVGILSWVNFVAMAASMIGAVVALPPSSVTELHTSIGALLQVCLALLIVSMTKIFPNAHDTWHCAVMMVSGVQTPVPGMLSLSSWLLVLPSGFCAQPRYAMGAGPWPPF